MYRLIHKIEVCILLIALFTFTFGFSNTLSNFEKLDEFLKISGNLKTISCIIHMKDLTRKSDVVFNFVYKRNGGKMRIEYTYPVGMKGSKISVDGEYFYMYLASLKKTVKKKIEKGKSKIPGSEMGIFFNYVVGDIKKISSYEIEFVREENLTMSIDDAKYDGKTYLLNFKYEKEREEVWIDVEKLVPVKVRIYKNGEPRLEISVLKVELNKEIPDSIFKLQ